jgi:hypothetical protein
VQIVFAGFLAFGGLVALIAGVHGLRRTSAIIADGEPVVALVTRPPARCERPLLQFETADGRVMAVVSPVMLALGSSVPLVYDPADPRDVVLPGHRRTRLDQGFAVAGAAVILAAVVSAVPLALTQA